MSVAAALGRRVERIFALLGLLFVLYHSAFRLDRLTSHSMQPTFQGRSIDDGDFVLTERITGRWRAPRRWEVVGLHSDEGLHLMKRVVGLPGETVSLRQGRLRVNDAPVEHAGGSPASYLAYGNLTSGASAACGSGYYVLGDYTQDSHDSRFDGSVAPHRLTGRAWLILWPPSRFGWVR
jgi:signal peptidase I